MKKFALLTILLPACSGIDDDPIAGSSELGADVASSSSESGEPCDSECFDPEIDADFDAELEWDLTQCYNEDAYCRFGYGIDDEGCHEVLINGRCYGSQPAGSNVSSGCSCRLWIAVPTPTCPTCGYWGNIGWTLAYGTCESGNAQYTCPTGSSFKIHCSNKVGGCT